MISQRLVSEPPRSQPCLQLPGRSALPPQGEPSRTAEAGARTRGCALFPAGSHPHFSPPQPPPRAHTLQPRLCRPRPCQARAAEGERARGRRRDASQGESPQSPCHPALRRGRRAHGTPQRVPAADAVAAAAAVVAAERAAVPAQPSDPGEEQPLGLGAATRCMPLPGSLASTPGPPRGLGQKQGRKRGSPLVRVVLAWATVPDSSAPVSPSAKRRDQLRVQRTRFLLEPRTGFGN